MASINVNMVDDIIITASFFEQHSQRHERKNWLCGLQQRGNLVRSQGSAAGEVQRAEFAVPSKIACCASWS